MSANSVKKSNDILWHSELTQQNLDYTCMNDIHSAIDLLALLGEGCKDILKLLTGNLGRPRICWQTTIP